MRAVETADRAVSSVLPGATLARLVMVHWRDSNIKADCYSPEPMTGYLTDTCLAMFDEVVAWASGTGLWVTLTSRAAEAAGDGGQGHTVFTNATLADQMVAMWRFLAGRYATADRIAGYEVMSEPRVDGAEIVHPFEQRACDAVKAADPGAVCFVGPGPFYDRSNLGPEWLIRNNSQVIYAANFFVPKVWITAGSATAAATRYGGRGQCCDLAQAKTCKTVAGGCNATITLGKHWLESQLATVDAFRANFSVPVWIDQWGVWEAVGGGAASQAAYLADVLELFEARSLHWAYWFWKDPWGEQHCVASPDQGDHTRGYEYAIMCQLDNGTEHQNAVAIGALKKYIGAPRPLEEAALPWRCTSDASCQLNGRCESNGSCSCDPGWGAANCSALQLGESQRAYTGRTSATTTWGGARGPRG